MATNNVVTGSVFTRAIMALCIYTMAIVTNQKKKIGRPFMSIRIGGHETTVLYDTGADIFCISEQEFRKITPTNRPEQIQTLIGQEFKSANNNRLEVKGAYMMMMKILGKTMKHKNLSETVILGSDFIHQHQLIYCPGVING
jgi:hypothetical protein